MLSPGLESESNSYPTQLKLLHLGRNRIWSFSSAEHLEVVTLKHNHNEVIAKVNLERQIKIQSPGKRHFLCFSHPLEQQLKELKYKSDRNRHFQLLPPFSCAGRGSPRDWWRLFNCPAFHYPSPGQQGCGWWFIPQPGLHRACKGEAAPARNSAFKQAVSDPNSVSRRTKKGEKKNRKGEQKLRFLWATFTSIFLTLHQTSTLGANLICFFLREPPGFGPASSQPPQ